MTDFVRVLRFDGTRWVTSVTIEGARYPHGYALSPDGAVWVLVHQGMESGWTEIWRRAPGAGDRWEQVAPSTFGRDRAMRATSIMPAGDSDLYVVGERPNVDVGLYRIDVDGR